MNSLCNHIIPRTSQKPLLLDAFYESSDTPLPVIIFCHGYKGFKDWGAWNMMGKAFARRTEHVEVKAKFLFIKFNFSHNGGTMENPIDFPDLEAFGNNNYSQEVQDLNDVIDWVITSDLPVDTDRIYLLGHSRAGGITSIVASRNPSVSKLVTLAGVSDYASRFPQGEQLQEWKEKGIFYVKNGRTGQEMPHFYQFYIDFEQNNDLLDIKKAVQKLTIPHLIIHGDADEAVSIQEAYDIKSWRPETELRIICRAGHTFGASHPWNHDHLPADLRQVVQCVVNFCSE